VGRNRQMAATRRSVQAPLRLGSGQLVAHVKATGKLWHHFHGTYWATIVLVTTSPKHATDLRRVLERVHGKKVWVRGKTPRSLQADIKRPKLDDVLAFLEAHRIDRGGEAIDGVERSIDHGPVFEIEVETQPKEQLSMFPNPAWRAVFK